MPWWREVVPLGKHHLALCFVILIFSAGQGGNACPTSVSTLADMKSGIDCGGDGSCTLTAPELAAYTFDDPAETNAALGSTGTFTVTLKCGTIANSGCTGAECVGCVGTVTRTLSGTADVGSTCDTSEPDGSAASYTVTGGGDCAATAVCSGGFYDGGTFTAATGATAVDLVKISLMKDSTEHDAVTGLSAASTNGYLIGHDSTSSVTDGVVSITGLKIIKTAAFTNAFTLDFVAIGSAGNTDATSSSAFKLRHDSISYAWGSTPTAFVGADVSSVFTHTIDTTITLTALDAAGNTCEGILAADVIDVLTTLQVGQTSGAQDSSSASSFDAIADATTKLVSAASLTSDKEITFGDGGTATIASSDLTILQHSGLYYRFQFTDVTAWTSGAATLASSSVFRLDPAALVVHAGDATYEPTVIRVDGTPSDTLDADGFHTAIQVKLVDDAGQVAELSACLNCVIARLVKCDDNVPVASGATGYEYDHTTTTCSTVSQAACATSSGACTSNDLSTADGVWKNTLSSTTASTTANVVAGVATFANLQANFAVGAGYKIKFTFNPTASTAVEPTSAHTNTRGQQVLPATTDTVTSFFIRPHTLGIVQQPGGDGVDLVGGGDGVTGTPDGVGVGTVFRVQPAVILKGDGYSFTSSWGMHGHVPITAAVKVVSCTQVDCAGSCDATSCTDGASVSITVEDTVTSGVSPASIQATSATNDDTLTSTFSGTAGSGTVDVQARYLAAVGGIGYIWRDLKASTSYSGGGNENVVLQFLVGLGCGVLANVGTTCTGVDSSPFDIFAAPNPPVDLKVEPYGPLGFRLQMTPGAITRMRPLSGYMIEVDTCTQSETKFADSASAACATHSHAYLASDDLYTELGGDYTTGGGGTEDVYAAWDPLTPGNAAAGTITFTPSKHMYEGDSIALGLGAPGTVTDASTTSCTPTGTHADWFDVALDAATSTVTLTVAANKTILKGTPVEVILGTDCKIYNPALKGDSGAADAYFTAMGTAPEQYYGTTQLAGTVSPAKIAPLLPTYMIAPVVGGTAETPGRYDNCIGGGCDAFGASTHVQLKTIQDGSSMDLAWSGDLQVSGVGGSCGATGGTTAGSGWPGNRYCSSESWSGYDSAHPAGDNGAPIASGVSLANDDAACRSGTSNKNPCALSVGSTWTLGMGISGYDSTTPTTFALTFQHSKAIPVGSTISVTLSNTAYTSGPTGTSTVITDGDTLVAASAITTWTAAYDDSTDVLTLTVVGGHVKAGDKVVCTVTGFEGLTLTDGQPTGAVGEVKIGETTTVIFRNGDSASNYLYPATTTSDAAGDTIPGDTGSPTKSYAVSTTRLAITEGSIYSFRVYAYNGRFKSTAATTQVQARAISPPAQVAYIPSQKAETVGVNMIWDTADVATAVEIGLYFTPRVALSAGMLVSLVLPGFTTTDSFVDIAAVQAATGTSPDYSNAGNAHAIFGAASWTKNTSTLVLTVDATSAAHVEIAAFIPSSHGITTPSVAYAWPTFMRANITALSVDWLSPFPRKTNPRLGFVMQYSTDSSFANDVTTVVHPERLSEGIVDSSQLTYLTADLAADDTTITLADEAYSGEHSYLAGKYIQIDEEIIKVTSVSTPDLTVTRGHLGTLPVAHTVTSGTPADAGTPCACTAGSTSAGGGTCSCTYISLIYMGATGSGGGTAKDDKVGTGCQLGSVAACNPDNYDWSISTTHTGFRTVQQGTVLSGVNDAADWLNPSCGVSCTAATLTSGREFGNPAIYPSAAAVPEPGNPNYYPKVSATTISAGVLSGATYSTTSVTETSPVILVADASSIAAKYILVGTEFMYVEQVTKGVGSVSFASGGVGCTVGDGTLVQTATQGLGFSATYTVDESGTIDSITITNPGRGYFSNPPALSLNPSATCATTYPSLQAILSSNAAVVQRGSFGSTAATHSAGATVSRLWWPTQANAREPGQQFFFRMAAYNSAGFSAWKKYGIKYTELTPPVLQNKGGELVEIIATGMGKTKTNMSVWFGHTLENGTPNWNISRECTSIELLDIAGTRLRCRAPAWDGKNHDVFIRYQEGVMERIQYISNAIGYEPPVVSRVSPQMVQATGTVTLTIEGKNFGTAGGNRSAVLDGGSGAKSIIKCNPLVYVGDTQLKCTLTTKGTQTLKGTVLLTVGTDGQGGAQQSKPSKATNVATLPEEVELQATLSTDIATIPQGSAERVQFIASFKDNLVAALSGVTASQIEVTSVLAGSVIVAFVIRPNPDSITALTPAQIAADFAAQAANPTSALRTGSVTGGISGVVVPAWVEEAAAAAGATATATAEPSYFTLCAPRSYTAFDMETCYDCCALKCETGPEIPAVGGVPVLAGYRAQVCQNQCLNHCGYNIPISTLAGMA